MKKILTLLLLASATSNLLAHGGYYGGYRGGYYGGGYGAAVGTSIAAGAITGAAIASANQDPVAKEEARAMRAERKERERDARDARKYGKSSSDEKPVTRGKRNYGGGRTSKRTPEEIDAEIQALKEERKSAAAA
jgi:hypothetical protein